MKENSSYKWIVLGNIMIGTFMAVLDTTVVNTGLPVIMGTLGADINVAEWVLTGYMLSMAIVLPAAGWLSERFGYKKIYFLSLLIFTAGSFMCGNSSTIEELIFWRVIEGFGCGMLLPVGMAIVSDVFPPEQRGMALGFWSVASAASVSFGPTIGGYLVDYMNWNYIFYVNIPVGIVALVVTALVQKEHVKGTRIPFDIPGFITSALFLPVFMFGLAEVNSASNSMGWSSPVVLGCMWVAAVSFLLFLYFEFTVKVPLINLRLFVDKDFALSNLILFVFGIGMFGSTFLIPLYLQNNLGYTALQAGLFFMPVGIVQGIASPLVGKLMQRVSPKFFIISGLLLMAISFYMNYYLSLETDKEYIMFSLYLRGLGMGLLFTPLLTLALVNIRNSDMAQASSITNIVRQMGGSFGVAIFSHLLTQRSAFHTQRYSEALNYTGNLYHQTLHSLGQFIEHAAGRTSAEAREVAELLVMKNVRLQGYISAINDDFFVAFVITILCVVPVLFLVTKPNIDRHL